MMWTSGVLDIFIKTEYSYLVKTGMLEHAMFEENERDCPYLLVNDVDAYIEELIGICKYNDYVIGIICNKSSDFKKYSRIPQSFRVSENSIRGRSPTHYIVDFDCIDANINIAHDAIMRSCNFTDAKYFKTKCLLPKEIV